MEGTTTTIGTNPLNLRGGGHGGTGREPNELRYAGPPSEKVVGTHTRRSNNTTITNRMYNNHRGGSPSEKVGGFNTSQGYNTIIKNQITIWNITKSPGPKL